MKKQIIHEKIVLGGLIPNDHHFRMTVDALGQIHLLIYNPFKKNEEQEYQLVNLTSNSMGSLKSTIRFVEKNLEYCHFSVCTNSINSIKTSFLFVYPRSEKLADGNGQINTKLIEDGQLKNEWCMGDGIANVQVDGKGRIWTSYFDEGIFGNLGWEGDGLGRSGLVCWDFDGNQLLDFNQMASEKVPPIDDCYAMNVVGEEEVWICYYTDFSMVKIKGNRVVDWWSAPVQGARCFAVYNQIVVMGPGYKEDFFTGFKLLSDHQISTPIRFKISDETGHILKARNPIGRGSKIYFCENKQIYILDVAQMV